MTVFDVSRRSVLSGLAGIAALGAIPQAVFALSTDTARALVDRRVADINAVIASGKSESAMIRDFEGIFDRYADVPIIARTALGNDWRRATDAQRRNFVVAFRGYISRKYGRRFREFVGGKIEVRSASTVPNGVEVRAIAILSGQAPFEVSFVISDGSGQPKFINMFIEGINMITSERTEIGAMLDRRRGDIDGLIVALQSA
jgi:phospholipid transport system substrate-binding protein